MNALGASLAVLLYPGNPLDPALFTWVGFTVVLAPVPDYDIPIGLRHRGFTHTLLGALTFSTPLFLAVSYISSSWLLGVIAFLGVLSAFLLHFLGDLMTHTPFKPLYPLSDREIGGWGLFSTSDEAANRVFFKIGTTALALSMLFRLSLVMDLVSFIISATAVLVLLGVLFEMVKLTTKPLSESRKRPPRPGPRPAGRRTPSLPRGSKSSKSESGGDGRKAARGGPRSPRPAPAGRGWGGSAGGTEQTL